MQSIRDIDVSNKRILVRADFNVTIDEHGQIVDDFRIRATLPTIEYLLKQSAKVILMSHLGKPNGIVNESLRLKPIGEKIKEYLNLPVHQANDCTGADIERWTNRIGPGEILLLENLRFHPSEEANDDSFAKELAKLGDIYVNDAFGVCHRKHASVAAITNYLPSYAGLLLEKEITVLKNILENPVRPFAVIIGGAKISTKMKVIKRFLQGADNILLGGALANTVLHAKGIAIGKSVIEEGMIEEVQNLQLTDTKLHIPVDTIVSSDMSGKGEIRMAAVGKTREDELILDIGPETEELFAGVLNGAKTVVWNGPMGLFEVAQFAHGTASVARTILACDCFSVIGGGETTAYMHQLGLLDKFSHVSTGGGAMLDFLAGEKMPGLEALKDAN